jgi:hypothetical protein
MKQSSSWEDNNCSDSQQVLSWNPQVRTSFHKSSPSHPSLSHKNRIHILTPYSFKIHLSHLHPDVPSGLFPSDFRTKILHTVRISTMPATCRTHIILFHLITLIIFSEEYKFRRSPVYNFLKPPVIYSPIKSKYSPQHCFHTSSIYVNSFIISFVPPQHKLVEHFIPH